MMIMVVNCHEMLSVNEIGVCLKKKQRLGVQTSNKLKVYDLLDLGHESLKTKHVLCWKKDA